MLKVWGELTFDEIGKTLGIPLHTAASRYRHALGNLKTILTKQQNERLILRTRKRAPGTFAG